MGYRIDNVKNRFKRFLLNWILGESTVQNIQSIFGIVQTEHLKNMNIHEMVKTVESSLDIKYRRSFKNKSSTKIVTCDCGSPYHNILFESDPWVYNGGDYYSDDPEIYISFQMASEGGFFHRLYNAVKFVMFHTDYDWQQILLSKKQVKEIIRYLNEQLIIHRNCKKQIAKNKNFARIYKFDPDWALKPGVHIEDLMECREISIETVCKNLDVTREELKELIDGEITIDLDLADKLEFTLGVPSKMWMNYQENYNRFTLRYPDHKTTEDGVVYHDHPVDE